MKKNGFINNELETSQDAFDFARFSKPRAVDRPAPFYSWNERMEPDELRRQIDLIAEGGWGGAFLHSRIGLITPYLGKEWFAAIDATINQSIKRGLKVWLYDEDKWPSGFSGGTVPLADRSFRMQTLIAQDEKSSVPPDCEPIGKPQRRLKFYVWTAPLGHAWFNGTCYTSLLNKRAMKKFLDDAYVSYYKRFKEHYGNTILGEFTDEPCSLVRMRIPDSSVPFTTELIDRFKEMHGYDPLKHLHLLYMEEPGAARFRIHYFRTVNDLFEHNFSQQLGDWCAEHKIALTGHYMSEDSLYLQQLWGVKVMPNYRRQGIPGIDHLGRHVGNTVTAKQCQSVVNQYGKSRMLSEIYGVDGGSLSFEDRAWIAEQQMCLGVNLLNPHLSLYTMTGCRKRDYPQNIFYQQPFWPLNHVLDDRLSRVCAALSQGKYHAEMLVIHPGESAFMHWQTKTERGASDDLLESDWNPIAQEARAKIDAIDNDFGALSEALLQAQRTFDYGDETILADDGKVVVDDSRPLLRVGVMKYPLVIIPSMSTIATTTVVLLERFIAAGGKVIRCGTAPKCLDGEPHKRVEKLMSQIPEISKTTLVSYLSKTYPPKVLVKEQSGKDIVKLYVHIRDFGDGDRLVYLANLDRFQNIKAEIACAGDFQSVKYLNVETGKTQNLISEKTDERLNFRLPFAPAQAHLLILQHQPARGDNTIELIKPIKKKSITLNQWKVERLDDNAITLDYASWICDNDHRSWKAVPVIGIQDYLNSIHYNGPLTLRYPVRTKNLSPKRKVFLVVEHSDRYQIKVNGTEVKYKGLPAWLDFRYLPIDITGLLKNNKNIIELHCPSFQHGNLASVEDSFARYGTEIESIYLVGDFSVKGKFIKENPVASHWQDFGLPPIKVRCFEFRSFFLTNPEELKRGETTKQGLPFYAGRIELRTTLPPIEKGYAWSITISRLDCPVAEVLIDNRVIGHFVCHPFEVNIPSNVCRTQARLTIRLYTTLRNLLGPHHHPEGELAAVGPNCFTALPVIDKKTDANVWIQQWETRKKIDGWNDRYCFVWLGYQGRIQLVGRHLEKQ